MASPSTAAGPDGSVTTLRITGMTCAACERRVTRALSALPGVRTVSVSAVRGRATLEGVAPPDDAVRAALATAGYQLGAPAWFARDRRAWATAGAASLVVAVVGWLAVRSGLEAPTPDAEPGGAAGSLVLALLVGLAAGVSTCMAMVGGLVLGISAGRAGAASDDARPPTGSARSGAALRPHLVFSAGRLAGFAAGGALLGAVGSAARLPGPVVAGAAVLAAVVMALLGVRLTGLSPRLSGWTLTLPRHWADRVGLHRDRGLLAAGAATFLLPCGFTQAMQLYAVSLGSPGRAAAVMTAFALGTAPGLLGLGALGSLSGGRDRAGTGATGSTGRTGGAVRVIGVVVLAFAVVTGSGGLRALGLDLPRLPGASAGASGFAAGTVSPNVQLADDVQIVSMTQSAHGYSPEHTTVWAGVPIRWTIDATAGFSCSSSLRIPARQLAVDLTREGRHVVDVPALRVGTMQFSCLMGMYGGSFRAIPRPGA